jgi:L-rhamnonate dehydratase
MKITNVRVFRVEGGMREGEVLYEIRRGVLAPEQSSPYRGVFTQIETDEGLTGLSYGGSPGIKEAGQLLVGEDPTRYEYLWERLHGRLYLRERLDVVAVLDLALWDLIGKIRGEPVYRLLGGPTRERVRAYAGMLGFSTEPEAAARRSKEFVAKGFTALKWYLSHNERAGNEGLAKNVALVRAVREAVGPDVDLMVDWLLSDPTKNSLLYAIKLAQRLEEFRPTWIEEPLSFEDLNAHAALARATRIPLAFGEHWMSRWGMKSLIEHGATVLQPDPNGAGGITEMRKILAVASTYGLSVVPHSNESSRNNLHLLFSAPERICPLGEWGYKINLNVQYFFKDFYQPVGGYFEPPAGPGFGYELDEGKIERREEVI